MSNNIQTLVNQWEKRPRRQLDFAEVEDLEWCNGFLKAFVPAFYEIKAAFKVEPEAPIIIQMPPLVPRAPVGPLKTLPLTEPNDLPAWDCPRCDQKNAGWAKVCGRCEASREAPMQAADGPNPSTQAETAPAAAPSTRTPKASRSRAGTGGAKGRKSGSAGKPAAAPAKPIVEPPGQAPSEPASTVPPGMRAVLGNDAPPPKLEPIG